MASTYLLKLEKRVMLPLQNPPEESQGWNHSSDLPSTPTLKGWTVLKTWSPVSLTDRADVPVGSYFGCGPCPTHMF